MRRGWRGSLAAALAAALLLGMPSAASAATLPDDYELPIHGGGWGHGYGLSQWGARGMAEAGKSWPTILSHYYTGVTIADENEGRNIRARVVLSRAALLVGDESPRTPVVARWADGTAAGSNSDATPYLRARPTADGMALERSASPGGPWTHVASGATNLRFFPGDGAVAVPVHEHVYKTVLGESWEVYYFRGFVEAYRQSATAVDGINQLRMNHYLYGAVPREMPASWTANAVRAQAVAARTYAFWRIDHPRASHFDIYVTTYDQVYKGYGRRKTPSSTLSVHESGAANDAVDATAGKVLKKGGKAVFSQYHSSSGGHTADNVWNDHLEPVSDPADGHPDNKNHRWTHDVTVATIEKAWPAIGDLVTLEVVARDGHGPWGGRATTVRLVGTAKTLDVTGNTFRSKLGLKSTLFSFHTPPFTDDEGLAHEPNIIAIWEAGITAGCNAAGDRFCPHDPVTRGQMAQFLAKALGLGPASKDYFADDGASSFEDAINRIAEAGITAGCGGDRFCPGESVTRAQMAAFLDAAKGLPAAGTDYFTDDDGSSFEPAINRIAAAGITAGCSASRYCPGRAVTRAEMATFLARAFLS